jgi:hypothetical protein
VARATLTPIRLLSLAAALALCLLLAAPDGRAQEAGGTYKNPVSKEFADTFADPAVIKGKDGYWYAYGTTDPLREGEKQFQVPLYQRQYSWRDAELG